MKQMGDAQVMDNVDLNPLVALDTLLAEGRVTGAARRLGLSSSAMSPTLTRRRSATGDPLVARAGRGLDRMPPTAWRREDART
jgi:DNA-binding transcriptional LysR family regulator